MSQLNKTNQKTNQTLNIILPTKELYIELDKILYLTGSVIKLSNDIFGILKVTLIDGSVLVFHALLNYELNHVEPNQEMEAMFKSIRTSNLFIANGSI